VEVMGGGEKTMEAYLVIETGYEGIESLCWLTVNKEEAITKREEMIDKKFQERKEMWEEWNKDPELKEINHPMKKREDIADFFCIQKWDGEEFDCVCRELGVKVSKPMFR